MADDLDILGVVPSDRKKLEAMNITKLDQIALLDHKRLGMGRSKGQRIIQRARNILAHRNIEDININGDDEVEIVVQNLNDAIKKSVFSVLGVYDIQPGSIRATTRDDQIILTRKTSAFDHVVDNAELQQDILHHQKEDEREKEGMILPQDEVEEFGRERGFDGFWQNVFSEIKGNEVVKQALATSMFSTFDEPVHTLVIGEPGSSKTLAKEIMEQSFEDMSTIGSNTTRAGLVCHLGTGDLGALPHSDRKVVLVDEFDKIPEEDTEYCYELLSNGRCSVHSARIHNEIESHFIMIAMGNPVKGVFEGNPLDNIPVPPLLASRFALIVKTEKISQDDRISLFREKFYGDSEVRRKSLHYDQWVKKARSHMPGIEAAEKRVDQYLQHASDIVEEYHGTNLRRDLRMGDYIRRIPFSIARASFGDVTEEVLEKSENLLRNSVQSWTN